MTARGRQGPLPRSDLGYVRKIARVSSRLRLTPALRDVIEQLSDAPDEVWGMLLSSRSGRPTGTVYPILDRLERECYVRSHWEPENGRSGPRRRLYVLTNTGRAWAAEQLARQKDRQGGRG